MSLLAPTGGPSEQPGARPPPPAVARNSIVVATCTAVSRLTGFARVAAVAAVLGPTYLGNTYQALNLLPNMVFGMLTGSLFGTLLVPPLVRHIDRGDRPSIDRLVGGFLGMAVAAFLAITVILIATGPLVLAVLSAGVPDPTVAALQRRVGWLLLAMLMPQIVLYAIAGAGEAVLNAHGRFVTASLAPSLENVAIIATMGAFAAVTGPGTDLASVQDRHLLLLGLGTTAGVAVHAAVQWFGARRVGVRLRPRAGWRDEQVREVMRRSVPSLGYSGLRAARSFGALMVANRIPGGVVAFDLALNFLHLPVAVGSRPVAIALLPQLARSAHASRLRQFHDELRHGRALALFVTAPAAAAYLLLAFPIAQAVSLGRMDTATGVALVALSLAALAPGVLGESEFLMATHAAYALDDARSPYRSMLLRTAVAGFGMGLAMLVGSGPVVLVVLGLSMSASDALGAWHLTARVRRNLPPIQSSLWPVVRRVAGSCVLMAGPAYLVAQQLSRRLPGPWAEQVAIVAAAAAGVIVYLGSQLLWRAPELWDFLSGARAPRLDADQTPKPWSP